MSSSPGARLAIGTAQFGLAYGVANRAGQVTEREVAAILRCASDAGVDTLDTAIAYGSSEQRLGEAGIGAWRVISKLPALPDDEPNVGEWVLRSVQESLRRLRLERLSGVLLHRPGDLLGRHGEALFGALQQLKRRGHAEKIGVSIYDPQELEPLLERFEFDIVQAPFNVFDRRLAVSGWLAQLHERRIEIHSRSVFLQGLLLMSSSARPAAFRRWEPLWKRWHEWMEEQGVDPLRACLGFVLSHDDIDRVVVGVDSLAQLQEILRKAQEPPRIPPPDVMTDDPDLINPSRWRLS